MFLSESVVSRVAAEAQDSNDAPFYNGRIQPVKKRAAML
jgi:hypothetical protein